MVVCMIMNGAVWVVMVMIVRCNRVADDADGCAILVIEMTVMMVTRDS